MKEIVEVQVTKQDILDGLKNEYGMDSFNDVKGIDLETQMILSRADSGDEGYGVNSFTLTIKNGMLHTIISDMPHINFEDIN